MVKIIPMQQCRTLDSWYPHEVVSSQDKDIKYVVHINPWANRHEQHVCECKGYQYRGRCRHQKEAHNAHCGWNAVESDVKQTSAQEAERICPECGGPTSYAMWEQNEG